jgi:hypothetical protein
VRLNRLWGAVCAFAGIFLCMWALSWIKADVLNGDLQRHCDIRTASFPVERSCTQDDGTVLGANSPLFDGIFFGSLTAAAISLTAALTIEARQRNRTA